MSWWFAVTEHWMREGLSTALLCSLIPRLPGELVIADLMPTKEAAIPAYLGLFCLVVQPSGKVLFFMWMDTFAAMPWAFFCRAQESLRPSYKKPTVVAPPTGAEPKWEFRHASSPAEVQSYFLLAEISMHMSIISGRHRDKGCFSKLTGLLLMAV